MKYQLKDFNRNVPDQDLLDDLKAVAEKLGLGKISSRQYDANGENILREQLELGLVGGIKQLRKQVWTWYSFEKFQALSYSKIWKLFGSTLESNQYSGT